MKTRAVINILLTTFLFSSVAHTEESKNGTDPLGRVIVIRKLQQHPLMTDNLGREEREHINRTYNPYNPFNSFQVWARVNIGTKILSGQTVMFDERTGSRPYIFEFSDNKLNGSSFIKLAENEDFRASYRNNQLNGQVSYSIGESYVVEGNFTDGVPSGSVVVTEIRNYSSGEIIDGILETKKNKAAFIQSANLIWETYGKNLPVVATQIIKKHMRDSGYDVQRNLDLDDLIESYDEFTPIDGDY